MSEKQEVVKLDKKNEEAVVKSDVFLPYEFKTEIKNTIVLLDDERIKNLLSMLLTTNDIKNGIINVIKPEQELIAIIPKDAQEKYNKGLIDFMVDKKTGEDIAVLIDKNKKRSSNILRVKQKDVVDSAKLTNSLNAYSFQQSLEHLTEMVEDIRNRLDDIDERFDEELFGTIEAERKNLLIARKIENNETKRQMCTLAIDSLSKAKETCIKNINNYINKLEHIPDNDVMVLLKIVKNTDFIDDEVKKFARIQQMFSYVMACTQMLGYAYYLLDEQTTLEYIFNCDELLLDDEKIAKLSQIEKIFDMDFSNIWYRNPELYVCKIKQKILELQNKETYEVEFTGKQLLEVLNGDVSN